MTDRKLLEAAARAADYAVSFPADETFLPRWKPSAKSPSTFWNPLGSDGDALRLAVKLRLNIGFCIESVRGERWEMVEAFPAPDDDGHSYCPSEDFGKDPFAATRRAIVRAAAGRATPQVAYSRRGR